MLRLSPPRSTRRVPSWPAVLLACALSVLLLAAVHCSSYLSNDGHRHLSCPHRLRRTGTRSPPANRSTRTARSTTTALRAPRLA